MTSLGASYLVLGSFSNLREVCLCIHNNAQEEKNNMGDMGIKYLVLCYWPALEKLYLCKCNLYRSRF